MPEPLHGLLMQLVQASGLLQPELAGGGHSISLSELFAVHELDADGPLAQRDLSERLRLDKSTVSRLVAGLVRKGYVARERDPANRRLDRLMVTDAGRAAHREIREAFHARHVQVIDALTTTEREALITGLTGLLRALHTSKAGEANHAGAGRVGGAGQAGSTGQARDVGKAESAGRPRGSSKARDANHAGAGDAGRVG